LENLERLLEDLTGPLAPIRELALRLIGPDSTTDATSGAICISRRLKIAPEAYALRIYPGIPETLVTAYEEIHHCRIAEFYRDLLEHMNGAHLFEVTLFGVPPSMAKRPPQIDRSTAWPLDIGTAQENWRLDYQSTGADFFIGYGPYSDDEHLGYFLWPNGGIEALRRNGDRHGQWGDFRSFLVDELARAAAVYPKHEETMQAMLRHSSGWRGLLRRFTGLKV
jgi:hypothetical protein